MPIDYSRYPPDWSEIRERILERAEHRCEFCGVPNGSIRITRDGGEEILHPDNPSFDVQCHELGSWLLDVEHKSVRIVLTIAHLDHDEDNWEVNDDRLAALCQRCHLRYDAPEKARRSRVKKYKHSLFPL